MPIIQCERCGYEWEITTTRKPATHCQSCRARKVQTVQTAKGKCVIWSGNYAADLVTPVDEDGAAVMPGVRSCGYSDCVAPSHVIS